MRSPVSLFLALSFAATGVFAEITADQVAGKTLTLNKSKFMIGTDSSLTGVTDSGESLIGTWAVVDGKWCRTITEPARLAGKACQQATIKGRNMTLVRADGSTIVYKIK